MACGLYTQKVKSEPNGSWSKKEKKLQLPRQNNKADGGGRGSR